MSGVAPNSLEGNESVVEGLQWVEKNIFLDVAPTGVDESFPPVKRNNSAPPSVSYSSEWDMSASDADVNMTDGSAVSEDDDDAEGAVRRDRPPRANRRPCKAKRVRYNNFVEMMEQQVLGDPSVDVDSIAVPQWMSTNPTLESKFRRRFERFKESISGANRQEVGSGRQGPAPKRAMPPGRVQPRAKRQTGSQVADFSASSSSSVAPTSSASNT